MVHRNTKPSFTHQPSHGDCSPPLRLNQHCLLNSTPFPRVWSCLGREMLWGGWIPCRVVQAVSVGEAWLTLPGIHSRGRLHTNVCSETLQCPFCPKPIPCHTALSQINDCLLGNGDLLISGLLHQPGVISQQPQCCWFHNLK